MLLLSDVQEKDSLSKPAGDKVEIVLWIILEPWRGDLRMFRSHTISSLTAHTYTHTVNSVEKRCFIPSKMSEQELTTEKKEE